MTIHATEVETDWWWAGWFDAVAFGLGVWSAAQLLVLALDFVIRRLVL